jgi:hypothetical protein
VNVVLLLYLQRILLAGCETVKDLLLERRQWILRRDVQNSGTLLVPLRLALNPFIGYKKTMTLTEFGHSISLVVLILTSLSAFSVQK